MVSGPTSASRSSLAVVARIARHGLVAAECAALTGGRPDADGVAVCSRVDRIGRAAYVQRGVREIARAADVGSLVEAVRTFADESSFADPFEADRFRIDVHDPADRLGRSTTELATALADVIPFGPDLRDPLHRFLVVPVRCGDGSSEADPGFDVVFGEVVTSADGGHRRHEDKPWTTSSSLDSRFSRGLVNLVPDATSILDPCCGAGSIVVEAASLGIDATGVDWKPAMVGMTRENLAHYGYDADVHRGDSRETLVTERSRRRVDGGFDAVVTDLPYGHAIEADEVSIRAILERCAECAPVGVFVAPADISIWLRAAGFDHVEVHTAVKRRGFTRWIHVARRDA